MRLARDADFRQSLLGSADILLGLGSLTLSAAFHQRDRFLAVSADHMDRRAEGACDHTSAVHRLLGCLGAVCPDDDRFRSLHLASFPGPGTPRSVKSAPVAC